jgi:AcrR family transcriptional regulator
MWGDKMEETHSKAVKRDPEGTRRRILEAATEQFATLGLASARTGEIAKAAATNERLLHYYFGSKEQLYVAVLESMYADFAENEGGLIPSAIGQCRSFAHALRRTPRRSGSFR